MSEKVATFQERFNELLNSTTKSRSTIADEFHVAKQTISAWATGQSSPRTPVVSSLAEYFDVNLEWLVGYDVPMRPDRKLDLQLFNEEKPPDAPVTHEARILARGIDKLSPEQREQALAVVRAMFAMHEDYFKDEGDQSDDT